MGTAAAPTARVAKSVMTIAFLTILGAAAQ
jgi:hypothetical protein